MSWFSDAPLRQLLGVDTVTYFTLNKYDQIACLSTTPVSRYLSPHFPKPKRVRKPRAPKPKDGSQSIPLRRCVQCLTQRQVANQQRPKQVGHFRMQCLRFVRLQHHDASE